MIKRSILLIKEWIIMMIGFIFDLDGVIIDIVKFYY